MPMLRYSFCEVDNTPQKVTAGMVFFSHWAGRLMGVVRIPLLSCGEEHPESRMIASRNVHERITWICGFFIFFLS